METKVIQKPRLKVSNVITGMATSQFGKDRLIFSGLLVDLCSTGPVDESLFGIVGFMYG